VLLLRDRDKVARQPFGGLLGENEIEHIFLLARKT
jgi:hypothetical protein